MKKWMNYFLRRCCHTSERRICGTKSDPWRCEECGSEKVYWKIWFDPNLQEIISEADDKDDYWCDECQEHTYHVRESALMRDAVDPWWVDASVEDREHITGICNADRAFHHLCDAWWKARTNDAKIRIWRQENNEDI